MSLRLNIDDKYKTSIKLRETDAINTLRLIRSAIKDKDIQNRIGGDSKEINDQQILSLLQSLIKQRKDSIESFKMLNEILPKISLTLSILEFA